MTVQSIVENRLIADAAGVWQLENHREFGYSDGLESERYLQRVFDAAQDLGTRSAELEQHIKDWPSEYHLTTKRAQLLAGFSFDRSLRVLEVGCGCGAITRHLGENRSTGSRGTSPASSTCSTSSRSSTSASPSSTGRSRLAEAPSTASSSACCPPSPSSSTR